MRDGNGKHSVVWRKASVGTTHRQLALPILIAALAGCSSSQPELRSAAGLITPPQEFLGAVVADEPRAAYVGREILASGGNAVDAAVATYFAMAVTLPSNASLGGGGLCVVGDPTAKEIKTFEFTARAPAGARGGERPVAIPGNVRGFFALQARYGRLHWSQLIAPAENLARFGTPTSRALAADLRALQGPLLAEPSFRETFAAPEGTRLLADEEPLLQPDLALTLGRIRVEGANGFYRGPWAEAFVRAANRAGGDLVPADLQGYQVTIAPAITLPAGRGANAYFPPAPLVGGVVGAQLWAVLRGRDRYEDANPVERALLLAGASRQALAERGRWAAVPMPTAEADVQAPVASPVIQRLVADGIEPARATGALAPENPAAGLIVALDRRGQAVACGVTLNSLFGTGRLAAGTGVLLAAAPGAGGRGATLITPMIVVDEYAREFFFAAAAAGGLAAPVALGTVAANARLLERPLDEALAAKRLVGVPDGQTFVEEGMAADVLAALRQQGQPVTVVPTLGRVNAINCADSIPDNPETCVAASDPRGLGLATIAE